MPAPGSILTQDIFNVYNKVFSEKHMNLTDYTVNHSKNFVSILLDCHP